MFKALCVCGTLAMLMPAAATAYSLGDAKPPVAPDAPPKKPRVQIIINDAEPVVRKRAELLRFTQRDTRAGGPARVDGCLRQTGSRVSRPERPDERCANALPGDVFVPLR